MIAEFTTLTAKITVTST